MDDWTQVAWLDLQDGRLDGKTQVNEAIEQFLAERGLSRDQLPHEDIRVDIIYLEPGHACRTRIMIRTAVLSGRGTTAEATARLPEVRLAPDYSAPSPLWPQSDETDTLVPQSLLVKLVAWQRDFDASFRWDSGWNSDEARTRWAADAEHLAAELEAALVGKARLIVDLWPLDGD